MAVEVKKRSDLKTSWQPAPAHYWRAWREEVELSDQIIVNSTWSRSALLEKGVPVEKCLSSRWRMRWAKHAASLERYPDFFSDQRPLRVLFLGQITLRKGIGALLDAVEMLQGKPVHFHFAGRATSRSRMRCEAARRFPGRGRFRGRKRTGSIASRTFLFCRRSRMVLASRN